MPSLGPMEVLVILVVALLVLGPTKLPDAARSAGRALNEFRRWSSGLQSELQDALQPEPQPMAPTPLVDIDPTEAPDVATPVDLAPDDGAPGDPAAEDGGEPERGDTGTVSFT